MNRKDLKDYKYNQEWIKGRLEYIEEYRSTINKLTTVLSDLPKGSRTIYDNEAEKIAKLQDTLNELYNYIAEQQEKQKKILEQLNKLDQPYRTILELHYINGYNLVEVACKMKYNYEYTKKINSIALRKFDEIK
ncbi:MAG: hypothetical protein ACLSW4_03975 [Clostridia bacterium]